jgi:uncharacterized protein (TIGR02757 family)
MYGNALEYVFCSMKSIPFVELKEFLDVKVVEYNRPGFVKHDPITIPHRFSLKQDIEISAFFASILAWGLRKTIISKCSELFSLMDNSPYDFIRNHQEEDLKRFMNFKHRTFNTTDTLYFIEFLKIFYRKNSSLENAFISGISESSENTEEGLKNFHILFFALPEAPQRTRKHISTPFNGSACKRLNMFLRWMVRSDSNGVDFGIWNKIKPSQLVCPCDIHVLRVARKLGLIQRKQNDWLTALELTSHLKTFDSLDPVKYDFALFGLGIEEKF